MKKLLAAKLVGLALSAVATAATPASVGVRAVEEKMKKGLFHSREEAKRDSHRLERQGYHTRVNGKGHRWWVYYWCDSAQLPA